MACRVLAGAGCLCVWLSSPPSKAAWLGGAAGGACIVSWAEDKPTLPGCTGVTHVSIRVEEDMPEGEEVPPEEDATGIWERKG